ncbi:MAG: hypothetical protein H8D56_19760 [Planctomycetes bacterium]|nr:hypothetical protein [Planctomycetota bacterium]MBL7142799.1 hypothetical protein [Phycisphaerae bacterium]
MVNSRRLRNVVTAGLAVLLLCGGLSAGSSTRRASDGLLRVVPGRSLFCVRINRFENTIGAVNDFLKDVAPPSFDAETEVLSKLGEFLGDEHLRGVNTKGNFAIFGVVVQGEQGGGHPMANMFIGALVPVRNYDKFISRNPNCSEPDAEGISTIALDGQTMALATNFRRFAIVCAPNAHQKLGRVKEMMGQRQNSLFRVLDDGEKEMAATSPVWFYANVKQSSKLVQPLLFGGLEQMKAQLEKAKESGEGPPIDAAGIINFYGGIFKMLLEGTEHIMVGLSPTSEMCNVNVSVKPMPGSEFETMVGKPAGGDFGNLLGYLDDGAMMNIASKIDSKSLNASYMKLFELMGKMMGEGVPEKELKKMKKLTTKMINAMGDSLAMSFGFGEESSLFEIKYIIEVENKKAFEKVLEKELRMMQEGTFNKLYKGFGMEMDFKVERDIDTYQGVDIDAAKLTFKMGDEDAPQTRMLKQIFGDGLDYRLALVDNYCIYSIGADADKGIRELIDQVKSGGPKEIGSEMKAALDVIPNSKQAEAVGTYNYVRILNLLPKMILEPDGASLPNLKVPTKSNVAFASGFDDGKITMQIAMPKMHLLEIKSAFETIIPQIKKQEELKRQKRKE